jgi:3-oxoacyl-[acyl-carrier-protein] synthase III
MLMDEPLFPLGISAIATHQPSWLLGNDWFGDTIPRKFVHHTGIESRTISLEDEVTMGIRAVKNLQRQTACDLSDCAAVIFVSPSFVPLNVARRHLDPRRAEQERLRRAAKQLARRLSMPDCAAVGLNWFCSGFVRAISVARQRILPRLWLAKDQFLLVVTASRISRITDYACKQTAGLFGDLATATLVAPAGSSKYPTHFDILYSDARKQPADAPYFDFHLRQNVLTPQSDGTADVEAERLVFALDGLGIADLAPRAMSSAVTLALDSTGLRGDDIRYIIPHQAGTGIVRFTGMKLETAGIRGELINGLTQRVGNVSSCSIPYALNQTWNNLTGLITCPTAAVGAPGQKEVSHGCLLLRSTPHHDHQRHNLDKAA